MNKSTLVAFTAYILALAMLLSVLVGCSKKEDEGTKTESKTENVDNTDNTTENSQDNKNDDAESKKEDVSVSDSQSVTDSKPDENVEVFSVTAEMIDEIGGIVTVNNEAVKKGGSADITIKAEEGYILEYITVNGEVKSLESDMLSLTDISEDMAVKVKFKLVALQSISLATKPTKTNYYVGDTLNTEGLALTAVYNDGTEKTVTTGFTCDVTTLDTAGTITVNASYENMTASFTVSVEAVEVSSISVATKPTKTNYYVGDTVDTEGLALTVHYNNGTEELITSGYDYDASSFLYAGTVSISVSYNGKSTSFTVKVEEVEISSISINTLPIKTSYIVGETLDTEGLTIKTHYNNGTEKEITSGFSCNPKELDTVGPQTITVSYTDYSVGYDSYTTTFTVDVKKASIPSATVGQIITFGKYEQEDKTSDKEKIEWIVLDVKGGKALLLSKYALDHRSFDGGTWEASKPRTWLNDTFYNAAFNSSEQSLIATTTVKYPDNAPDDTGWAPTNYTTEDKIFLLSENEVNKYLPTEEQRRCAFTEYAKRKGFGGQTSNDYETSEGLPTCQWWLRSNGIWQYTILGIQYDGTVGQGSIYSVGVGVRPAMWVTIG